MSETTKTSDRINAETVNDRAKLLSHRLIARRLSSDMGMIERSKERILLLRSRGRDLPAFGEWMEILELPAEAIRRLIVSRSEDMTRLRISSPLGIASGMFVDDEPLRRRIHRAAKSGLALGVAHGVSGEGIGLAHRQDMTTPWRDAVERMGIVPTVSL